MTTIKILINSTISTPSACFMTLDLKNFYHFTTMIRFEYMKLPFSIIPDKIISLYNLKEEGGWVYIEIHQGMTGLKQAGLIAIDRLSRYLAKLGYTLSTKTPALWKHLTSNIYFSLVVDDFRVKYVGKDNADHLISALRELYTVSTDWKGTLLCGLTLNWNYTSGWVDVSMPVGTSDIMKYALFSSQWTKECQVYEEDTMQNSQLSRMKGAMNLGPIGNLQGG